MDAVALRARRLRQSFTTGFTLEVDDLLLREGELYSFVGPNGAGKTVLLEALSLLRPPEEGELHLFGERIFPDAGGWALARQQMAFALQQPYLFRGTVWENVEYGLRARGVARAQRTARVPAALERLGLGRLAATDGRHLSGGEAQRVAIARALVLETPVLLLDEPTAHVDAQHESVIEELLRDLRRQGRTTILLSTHDLEQARRLSDEIFVLVGGKLRQHAPENCFVGTVTRENGRWWFERRPGLRLRVLTERPGPSRIFIDPASILVSREALRSSGRNRLRGTVRAVEGTGPTVRVRLATNGTELVVSVTPESARELGLMPGELIHVTFKATGVRVYPL